MEARKPLQVYVAYGSDGIITGAALVDRGDADAQGWLRPGPGRVVDLVITASPICLGMRRTEIVEALREPVALDEDRIYTCDMCGALRTKAEGGTVFTVCDKCWQRHWRKGAPR